VTGRKKRPGGTEKQGGKGRLRCPGVGRKKTRVGRPRCDEEPTVTSEKTHATIPRYQLACGTDPKVWFMRKKGL